jgi:hypothetical protein
MWRYNASRIVASTRAANLTEASARTRRMREISISCPVNLDQSCRRLAG